MKGRYSIEINSDYITWDIIHKADKVGGFIEKVDDGLILWHSLKWREVAKAIRFIRAVWGIDVPRTEIYEDHIFGCIDHPVRVISERRTK